jgi:hypothetical protein
VRLKANVVMQKYRHEDDIISCLSAMDFLCASELLIEVKPTCHQEIKIIHTRLRGEVP